MNVFIRLNVQLVGRLERREVFRYQESSNQQRFIMSENEWFELLYDWDLRLTYHKHFKM